MEQDPGTAYWITWENHRRSRELADALGAHYVCLESDAPTLIRYLILGTKTAWFVARNRARVIFCQNPSIVLASVLCLLRIIVRYRLVTDRHSNFMMEHPPSESLKWRVFHALSRWTTRNADLTIVTNPPLATVVEDWGGRAFVLQDRIPRLRPSSPPRAPSILDGATGAAIMCVTSFADDEPIDELVAAFKDRSHVTAFLTGKHQGTPWEGRANELRRDGVILTGFISDQDYVDLMHNADAVIVLTTGEHVLTCGAYEALALRKPLILSDTQALRAYFGDAIVYVRPEAESIGAGVERLLQERQTRVSKVHETVDTLLVDWKSRFNALKRRLDHTALRSD